MGRIFVWQPRVIRIARLLHPLLDELGGSVNALAFKLSHNLSEGRRVYPNRLHAIFSGEKDVALNESTVETIEKGLLSLGLDVSQVKLEEDVSECKNPHCVKGWVEEDETPPYRGWTNCLTCNRDHRYPMNDTDHPLILDDPPSPEKISTLSANEVQVGGYHYRNIPGEQHWDRVWRMRGRGYFIGNITAYAERYDQKNGVEDLQKIIHYCQKLIELEQAATAGTGPPPGGGDKVLTPKQAGLDKEGKT